MSQFECECVCDCLRETLPRLWSARRHFGMSLFFSCAYVCVCVCVCVCLFLCLCLCL